MGKVSSHAGRVLVGLLEKRLVLYQASFGQTTKQGIYGNGTTQIVEYSGTACQARVRPKYFYNFSKFWFYCGPLVSDNVLFSKYSNEVHECMCVLLVLPNPRSSLTCVHFLGVA